MNVAPQLITDRLILRRWLPEDVEPFAQLNADPEVMRFLPQRLTRCEVEALITRIESHFDRHGFGLWAAQLRSTEDFIGFIGLNIPTFNAPFMPTVEIGWRLAQHFWGQGFATEGAIAALQFGFKDLELPEIVAFTTKTNRRSIAVMERLAMQHHPDNDFDHPGLPASHPLQRHVLYRLNRANFR
jgi:RimJ/RimL family protein N-acetyltransferase